MLVTSPTIIGRISQWIKKLSSMICRYSGLTWIEQFWKKGKRPIQKIGKSFKKSSPVLRFLNSRA